jgi:hypothetical protein
MGEEAYPSTAQPGAVGTTLISETGTCEADILLSFGFRFELFLVVSTQALLLLARLYSHWQRHTDSTF